MNSNLQRLFSIRSEEIKALLIAAFYFFCVLTALMVLRPARDSLGMEQGMDNLRWLFFATALVSFAVNPLFGWLVSHYKRITFITATYGFFALSLLCFYGLLSYAPHAVGRASGLIFYVWFSVFNLFCPMVFWALMVDRFSLEQSTRLFGIIAVGGTLGAIFGLWLASMLAVVLGTPALLLVSVGFLLLSIGAAWGLICCEPDREATESAISVGPSHEYSAGSQAFGGLNPRKIIGGTPWDGVVEVFKSRYLLGISGYMLLFSTVATLIYFARMEMVDALDKSTDSNTQILARLDMVTQGATLVLQLVAARQVMRRFGVSTALALLPVLMACGYFWFSCNRISGCNRRSGRCAQGYRTSHNPAGSRNTFHGCFRRRQIQIESLYRHFYLPGRGCARSGSCRANRQTFCRFRRACSNRFPPDGNLGTIGMVAWTRAKANGSTARNG